MLPNGTHGMRAVLHRDISDDDVERALDVMATALEGRSPGRPA